jgi:hypothetical protein
MDSTADYTAQDIDYAELQALMGRVEHAIEHGLALELLGMVKSSEQRRSASQDNPGDAQQHKNASKKARKERKPRKSIAPSEVIHHKLEGVSKGDPCPECPSGCLVKKKPKVFLRVSGTQPYEATRHIIERLSCNLCDYVVSAPLPAEAIGDAGEFLDEILRLRDPSLSAPIIMSDALASNLPTVSMDVVIALCNAHARRQFVDIVDDYPNDLNPILDSYGKIWALDKECQRINADAQQRLVHHQDK